MEDLENKISEIVDQYPDFAKGWIERRLDNEIKNNKKLPDEDTIRNIRDCLASLDEKSETIQKLYKISFKDMNTIQENWHKALAKKAEKLKEFGGKPFEYEPILKCDKGFQWVRLDTPESKDYEGNAMGHCVGSGIYDSNKTIIFSLRDKDNIPHITVEFDKENNYIEQIQGKGNTRPNEKYYDDILKLYEETGATNYDKLVGNQSYAVLNGKVLIGDDAILSCPEDTIFDSVYLSRDSKITKWNYSVSGDFDAYGSKLEYVNPDCVFGGIVDVRGTNIKEWHCNVPDDFDARFSKLEFVNPDCKFGGNVNIIFTNIKEWHHDVPGDFDACSYKLEYVSPDCKFGGGVVISNTPIKEWHCNVPCNFNAGESKLEFVNPDCVFGGDVSINGTKNLKEWHNDVPGKFDASWSNLESVNPDCVFGDHISINYTKNLKEWHCNVPGNFNAEGSKLEKIVNCKIEGKIHCDDNVEIINEEKQVMRM